MFKHWNLYISTDINYLEVILGLFWAVVKNIQNKSKKIWNKVKLFWSKRELTTKVRNNLGLSLCAMSRSAIVSAAKVWWLKLSQLSLCSAFDKENLIEFPLDSVYYLYKQSNPNPVLLSCASLWVNLLLHVCWYYKLKKKKKKRKIIFKIKEKKRKRKGNNDLADLPSHDMLHM